MQSRTSIQATRKAPPAHVAIRGLLVLAMSVVLAPRAFPAGKAPLSLRDVLTPEEFRQAGLQKLTAGELEFLSRRVLALGPAAAVTMVADAGPAPTISTNPVPPRAEPAAGQPGPETPLQGEAAFGQEQMLREAIEVSHKIPRVVTTRFLGTFRGWTGNTRFELENGQVWRQVDDSVFAVNLVNLSVTIKKGALGTFFLSVEGYGSRVKVERVR